MNRLTKFIKCAVLLAAGMLAVTDATGEISVMASREYVDRKVGPKRDKDDYKIYRKVKDCWIWTNWASPDATASAPADFLASVNAPTSDPVYFANGTWGGANQFWPNGNIKYMKNIGPYGTGSELSLNWSFTAYAEDGTTELFRFGATSVRTNATDETLICWDSVNPSVRLVTTDQIDGTIKKTDGTLRQLPKYLWLYEPDDPYLDDAKAWYTNYDHVVSGGGSALRKGGLLGINFDLPYDERAEFVVKVPASDNRRASVGVSNLGTNLTEQFVVSGSPSPLYKVLPGVIVDGINDAGVVAEINVIPRDPTRDPAQGIDPQTGVDRQLSAFAVVRYVLDNFISAAEAAADVAAHYYIPAGSPNAYHWMIADKDGTYIVEDGRVVQPASTTDGCAMVNFRVVSEGEYDPSGGYATDPYGRGSARFAAMTNAPSVQAGLASVRYTHAYASGWPWPDEFAGESDAQGPIPHDKIARLLVYANDKVAPKLDPTTRKPKARGNGCWQTLHSSIYDITNKTLRISVQETDDWFVFHLPASCAVKSVNGLKGDVVLSTANIKHGYSSLYNVINSVESNTQRHIDNKKNPHAVTAAQVGAVPKVLKAVDSDLTVRELNDEGDIIIKGQDGSDVLKVTVGKEDNNYTSSIYVDDFVDLTIGGVRSWGEYGLSSSAKKKLDVKTFTSTSNEFARKLGELENADERNFNTLDDKVKDIKYIARAFDVWKTNNYVAVGKDADGYAIKDGQVTRDSQVAIGEGAKAVEDRAVAIGKQSKASGVDSVAVGTKASSNGRGTVVIGNATATVGQDRAVVIGSIGDNKLVSNGSDTFTVSAEDLTKFYFRDKTLKSLIDDNLPTNAASKAEMEETKSALDAHVANTDNPHAVTAAQIGAVPFVEDSNGEKTAVTIGSRMSGASVGVHSFANGDGVTASIDGSHAEGGGTSAYGVYSHAEGVTTIASGDSSHSEGNGTTASGPNSHAEGDGTTASGSSSHAEGGATTALGDYSHAEGNGTTASGPNSHAEGAGTTASGAASHAEGVMSRTLSEHSFAFVWNGDNERAATYDSHGEGTFNINPVGGMDGFYIGEQTLHAILTNKADKSALNSHVENKSNPHAVTAEQVGALPLVEDKYGDKTAATIGTRSPSVDVGSNSLANGDGEVASGNYSHAEGSATTAAGDYSHAEGSATTAAGNYSHAEGAGTTAAGDYSHAEGVKAKTKEQDAFAFAWNGDSERDEYYPYESNGPGTFNINPVGGLDGFWIGEQTLGGILALKADKSAISATNTTFSNAVLAVGLNIDTNSVAVLNEIAKTFGGFPLGAGETATTVGGLLAALAAAVAWLKKNKVQTLKLNDNSVETSAESGVAKLDGFFTESNSLLNGRLAYSRNATGLKDRAFNTLSFDGTEYNLSTALAAVTPTASGQPRDLLIVATATAATTISFTAGTIKGDKPTIDGAGTWLITITEYASGVWYCRQIKMEDAA